MIPPVVHMVIQREPSAELEIQPPKQVEFSNVNFSFIRPEDQAFMDSMSKMAMEVTVRTAEPKPAPVKEDELTFNGKDLPQPAHLNPEREIVTDFYSERPECRVQRLAIEAAEKILDHGNPSERFVIYTGFPAGVPKDCFEVLDSHHSTFCLVDKTALAAGHPSCLVQCWVDRNAETFKIIPYSDPSGFGEAVAAEVMKEVSRS